MRNATPSRQLGALIHQKACVNLLSVWRRSWWHESGHLKWPQVQGPHSGNLLELIEDLEPAFQQTCKVSQGAVTSLSSSWGVCSHLDHLCNHQYQNMWRGRVKALDPSPWGTGLEASQATRLLCPVTDLVIHLTLPQRDGPTPGFCLRLGMRSFSDYYDMGD